MKCAIFLLFIGIVIACSQTSDNHNHPEWVGILQDSIFIDFLEVKFPTIVSEDTLIQVEFLYDLSKKELYLIYKQKETIAFSYRQYDIATAYI